MSMPNWTRIIGASVPESLDNPMIYHQKWIAFAQKSIDWFADLGEYESLGNCLGILGKYAELYPGLVARAAREATYLSRSTAKGAIVILFWLELYAC